MCCSRAKDTTDVLIFHRFTNSFKPSRTARCTRTDFQPLAPGQKSKPQTPQNLSKSVCEHRIPLHVPEVIHSIRIGGTLNMDRNPFRPSG